ncbi:reverse transcriptase domain-containing protein, partial [Klebsiella pneumoniae]|uniref:reverse transcriptase domain-containing protein n=1 Tax=Klebsiella pneumoniae TaxID=573 RepID=UPI0040558C5C
RIIQTYSEAVLGDYQCGFRRNRSTTDQIFILRQAMEKFREFDKSMHLLFIDFKQAFDSVDRRQMNKTLRENRHKKSRR